MRMVCVSQGEAVPGSGAAGAGGTQAADKKENLEDMAKKASEILGMDITIE